MAYLESENVIHRNLKLVSLLIDSNGDLKISDYGWGTPKDIAKGNSNYSWMKVLANCFPLGDSIGKKERAQTVVLKIKPKFEVLKWQSFIGKTHLTLVIFLGNPKINVNQQICYNWLLVSKMAKMRVKDFWFLFRFTCFLHRKILNEKFLLENSRVIWPLFSPEIVSL